MIEKGEVIVHFDLTLTGRCLPFLGSKNVPVMWSYSKSALVAYEARLLLGIMVATYTKTGLMSTALCLT